MDVGNRYKDKKEKSNTDIKMGSETCTSQLRVTHFPRTYLQQNSPCHKSERFFGVMKTALRCQCVSTRQGMLLQASCRWSATSYQGDKRSLASEAKQS
jgi:hypothetical protein